MEKMNLSLNRLGRGWDEFPEELWLPWIPAVSKARDSGRCGDGL